MKMIAKGLPSKAKLMVVFRVAKTAVQLILLIFFFMCGVDVLTSSFKLIAGKNINGLTQRGTLSNPLVGLVAGIIVTIMVQSSSTATAIIVSLVSSGVINTEQAIPVIMGSNIGTSVTNTFVSFTQVKDRDTFRQAFAGATIHDMFNWICVASFLSLEIITRSIPGSRGVLEFTTEMIVNSTFEASEHQSKESSGLKMLITPLTSKIVKLNKQVIECWARNESQSVTTMIMRFCDSNEQAILEHRVADPSLDCPTENPTGTVSCCSMFAKSPLSDTEIGIILLITSLALIIICLIVLVKLLNSVLQGPVQEVVKTYINSDIPCAPQLTGYCAICIGAIMTVIMQSSSVFTSLLTPLIGMGVVSLERCYPLTLGSNIGTTTTALLAAFTENSKHSIQIALVHLLFNVFGILLFYPVPFMRFPIPMAKFLGRITSKYRWFAIVYILTMFCIVPTVLLLLSSAGPAAFWTVIILITLVAVLVAVVNILQRKRPSILPKVFQNWNFVPIYLRSLEPYDKIITSVTSCRGTSEEETSPTSELKRVVPSPSLKTINSIDSGFVAPKYPQSDTP